MSKASIPCASNDGFQFPMLPNKFPSALSKIIYFIIHHNEGQSGYGNIGHWGMKWQIVNCDNATNSPPPPPHNPSEQIFL